MFDYRQTIINLINNTDNEPEHLKQTAQEIVVFLKGSDALNKEVLDNAPTQQTTEPVKKNFLDTFLIPFLSHRPKQITMLNEDLLILLYQKLTGKIVKNHAKFMTQKLEEMKFKHLVITEMPKVFIPPISLDGTNFKYQKLCEKYPAKAAVFVNMDFYKYRSGKWYSIILEDYLNNSDYFKEAQPPINVKKQIEKQVARPNKLQLPKTAISQKIPNENRVVGTCQRLVNGCRINDQEGNQIVYYNERMTRKYNLENGNQVTLIKTKNAIDEDTYLVDHSDNTVAESNLVSFGPALVFEKDDKLAVQKTINDDRLFEKNGLTSIYYPEDGESFNLAPGDVVELAWYKNDPENIRLRWKFPDKSAFEKSKKND